MYYITSNNKYDKCQFCDQKYDTKKDMYFLICTVERKLRLIMQGNFHKSSLFHGQASLYFQPIQYFL